MNEEEYAQQILDSKYEAQNLEELSRRQLHLNHKQRKQLHQLLKKHQQLFTGELGEWPNDEVNVELLSGVNLELIGRSK
jgi:hypothetical protein